VVEGDGHLMVDGRRHPERPMSRSAAVVVDGDRVLLVKAGAGAAQGRVEACRGACRDWRDARCRTGAGSPRGDMPGHRSRSGHRGPGEHTVATPTAVPNTTTSSSTTCAMSAPGRQPRRQCGSDADGVCWAGVEDLDRYPRHRGRGSRHPESACEPRTLEPLELSRS